MSRQTMVQFIIWMLFVHKNMHPATTACGRLVQARAFCAESRNACCSLTIDERKPLSISLGVMDRSAEKVTVRKPGVPELEELCGLIKLSTSDQTTLTLTSLKQAIFERQQPDTPPSTQTNSCFEFDLSSIRSDQPVAQVLVADLSGQIVGYIISHYHYSPWIGHGINIDDIYVKRGLTGREIIERELIEHVIASAKRENLKVLFFDSDKVEFNFMRSQCKWYRNNKDCDWSLLQISKPSNH